ncbi:hypothetical protein ACHHYP_16576 [Achlya hypogyna]|uniref:Secreted protein n=1 Tax=Achlya hypogyna TaxID=1202772 RepID=A0A0A7CNP6_ACHHY|nr:secreted protein [Achlya hypogyna]OQR96262.1 hypothetical protein ACHHYP_16576 [Achlya hypogyna]
MHGVVRRIVVLVLVAVLGVHCADCPPRVRKPWDELTAVEQALYVRAIALSMDRGFYDQFVQLHADQMTNMAAHNTCIFLFWHRLFLLGFENMLRALAPEFACLALPYYDYVQHNLDYVSSRCTTIASCSPVLGGLGGSNMRSPTARPARIHGHDFAGSRCISSQPVAHYCDVSAQSCMRCVPRGDWNTTYFSPDLNFNRVKQSIFTGTSMAQVSAAIEASPHDSVHATLGGAMANLFVAPADPIFYSHHATVDVLQTIHHKCLADAIGAEAAVASDPRIFTGCVIDGAPVAASTAVRHLRPPPPLAPFFAGLPATYGGLVDGTRVGNSSYSYELHGLLGALYEQCAAAGTGNATRRLTGSSGCRHLIRPVASADAAAFLAWRRAIYAAAAAQSLPAVAVEAEVEKMMVLLYEHCLPGSVTDYPRAFKSMWGINRVAPSKALLDAITSGSNPIQIRNWAAINQQYYGCSGQAA